MNRFESTLKVLLVLVAAGFLFSCGKSSEGEDTDKTARSTPPSAEVADESAELSLSDAPFGDVLAQAGYKAVSYRRIPAPVPGMKGSVVVYQSKDKGKGGGIIYFEEKGASHVLAWHWYFDDPPVSVTPVEINEDGLWDLQIKTKDGDQVELLHLDSFTLFGGEREDRIALNGNSSDPVDPMHPLWHCFDGDTSTAWISSVKGGQLAYIEVRAPLGIADGILSVQAPLGKGPKDCEILADGKTVQRFELKETAGEQLVQLDRAVVKAKSIRLVVESSYGEGKDVAISELGIK